MSMNRLLITGTGSSCGKTTITCALLAACRSRGIDTTAFKCGPDYIDPMFHRSVSGVQAYNLDPFFLDGNGLRRHISAHSENLSILEGAMGYYDGIACTAEASSYSIARETQTPAVLVVNAKGIGNSIGAVIEGFVRHRPDSNIKGVIFNDLRGMRYGDMRRVAESAGVKAYGYMSRRDELSIQSRHLGLMTAAEIVGLQDKLAEMGRQAEQSIDIDGLLELAETAPDISQYKPHSHEYIRHAPRVRLAVAKDEAFCFIYPENLELLRNMRCEIVFFSPLKDDKLPDNINGLYLCGGYPEIHAKALSENKSMLENIRLKITDGLPTVAECGGFMYLHDELDGHKMAGVIRGKAFETKKLQRFGYVTLTANTDNMLCRAGDTIRSHEFHYWDSDAPGDSFTGFKNGRGNSYKCIHSSDSLYAGFPHLYFPANPLFALNFVEKMVRYAPIRPIGRNVR